MSSRKTSDTGAYMSQYDQEVETRLKALEAGVKKVGEAVQKKSSAPAPTAPAQVSGDVEAKLDMLIGILKMSPGLNIEKLSKGKL
jgi:hypothetical protein